MRTASAGLQTYLLANNVTVKADLLTLTLADGTIKRWTSCEIPVTVGGYTFLASDGAVVPFFKRGGTTQTLALQISTLDLTLTGALDSTLVGTLANRGYFDGARVNIELLLSTGPTDVTNGTIPWYGGRVSECKPKGPAVSIRLKDDLETLGRLKLPRYTLSPACRNVVYDANCGLVCATWTLAGSVSGSTSTTLTTATAGITAKAANYFNLGCITFTSGALSGKSFQVASWSSPTFTLAFPFGTLPTNGDTFNCFPGCDRTYTRCDGTYSNKAHFRGFPHVPASEKGAI